MNLKNKKRIFLDYASITPVDARVAAEMARVQKNFWGNPSSLHAWGEEAKNILEDARVRIARLLHCRAQEIIFTSGGTESLNLAILGVVRAATKPRGVFEMPRSQKTPLGFLPHIIVSTIEHPAVLEPIKFLLKAGEIEASFVSPDHEGIVNPESIKKELKENTVLVIVQHANNEIGTIQPIQKIAKIITSHQKDTMTAIVKTCFLVDASQSVLFENADIERLGADMMVFDGIKMYGPRGAGVLLVKHGLEIAPISFGGGQEGGLRSGTENVAAAAGLAKALEIAVASREKESKRLKTLRDYAIAKILKEIPDASLNGSQENRLPNNINMCFQSKITPARLASGVVAGGPHSKVSKGTFDTLGQKVDSEFLVIKLDTLGFGVSAASACHTLSLENGSYVIESLGKTHSTSSGQADCASSSLRITLGRSTKKQDLDKLIIALKKII